MDNFYFYKTIQNTTIQVMNIFNDIKIAKYNSLKEIEKTITVPIKLANKAKYFYWIYDRKKEKVLPAMGLNLTGLGIDSARTDNRLAKIHYITPQDNSGVHYMPIPYTFNYELLISANYIIEMDQILEQILPYFDPCIYFKQRFKDVNNLDLNLRICLDSCTPENTEQYDDNSYRIINWRLGLSVYGYLFKPVGEGNIIKTVKSNLYDFGRFMERMVVDGTDPSNIITSIELNEEE